MNMFNLFPKKKSADEIINDANLTPSWEWTPTQTPTMLQAQNEIIEELMKEINGLRHLKEENVRLIEEVERLKRDIVDYVIVKDDKIEQLQKELNHMKAVAEGAISLRDSSDKTEKYYECNHCKYKIAHNTNQWGLCACCKDGLMVEKEEQKQTYFQPAQDDAYYQNTYAQKSTEYPIHWGGYSKEELLNIAKYEDSVIDWTADEGVPNDEEEWGCPCNVCKQPKEKTWKEAASDLSLRVIKLEKQIEELKIVSICLKQH
jgi:hypothetical protein